MKREAKERAILRAIRQAAKAQQPCPSNAELAALIGSPGAGTPSHIVQDLERRGEFTVARHGWARTVFFDDGHHTAFPSLRPSATSARRADRPAAVPIARTGAGAPCGSCGCRGDACSCPTFRAVRLPSHAAGGIVTVGAHG
jgi:hypothetical protein